jgi:fatty-acyl-CoA synthase
MFELRQITIGRLLNETTSRFPDRPAVEYRGKSVSYRELDEITDRLARGLLFLGVKKGSLIGIWGNDRPNTLFAFLAAEKIGAVAVMLGTSLRENEIKALLMQTGAEYLLFDEGFRDVSFPEICRSLDLPRMKAQVYMGDAPEPDFLSFHMLSERAQEVSPARLEEAKRAVFPADRDTVLFTSGTAGAAKGVVTSHYSRVNTTFAHVYALRADENDKFCIAIPMFHCFSLTAGVLSALCSGACVYFPADRHTETILNAISRDKCTVLNAVPTLFSALLSRNDIRNYDFSSLRTGFIGGSSYTAEFFQKVAGAMRFNLLPALGQTEATAGFTFADYGAPLAVRAGTVGAFMAYIEGEIREIGGNKSVRVGEVGEICIRGFNVMEGYLHQPELTGSVLDPDGWLHTGDLGALDENANIRMAGRLKELIIRGGENIAPGEIEESIAGDPRVKAVKVIGVPDRHYGEEICACVVLHSDAEMTKEEIRVLVAAQHAYYKIPKYVLFLDELPGTASGKTAFGKLQAMAGQLLGLA